MCDCVCAHTCMCVCVCVPIAYSQDRVSEHIYTDHIYWNWHIYYQKVSFNPLGQAKH